MGFKIFCKQTFRSIKNNLGIIFLLCVFIFFGIGLVIGSFSYLINTNKLVIQRAFQNGSEDAELKKDAFYWNETKINTKTITFNSDLKKEFKDKIGFPDLPKEELTEKFQNKFYNYLFENDGYVQSFWYGVNDGDNEWIKSDTEKKYLNFLDKFKYFDGNVLSYFFSIFFPEKIAADWDIRTTNIIENIKANVNVKKTIFDVTTITYLEEWIQHDFNNNNNNDLKPNYNKTLFQRNDFEYHLMIDYKKYNDFLTSSLTEEGSLPIFVTPKTLLNFNLHIGEEIELYSDVWPSDKKNQKVVVVGIFTNAGSLISFSDRLSIALPYGWYWNTLQKKVDFYKNKPIFISINVKNITNFLKRKYFIQKKIEDGNFFILKDESNSLIGDDSPNYHNYYVFWEVNVLIVAFTIVVTYILVCMVIAFITSQLITNNKETIKFFQALGMNNFEITLLNITDILFPILLTFIISIPSVFIVQNMISFLLVSQYPIILNYWMYSWQMIVAYMIICVFTIISFFVINFLALKKQIIISKKDSKFIRRIKDWKIRFWFYSKVTTTNKISFAINSTNVRKSVVTFLTLFISNLVILFGIGLKGSIEHQGTKVINFHKPYNNSSGIDSTLFSKTNSNSEFDLTQLSIKESDLIDDKNSFKNVDNLEKIVEIIKGYDKDKQKINLNDGYYLTSKTIETFIAPDLIKFLEEIKEMLEKNNVNVNIEKTLKKLIELYDEYQNLKNNLKSIYKYDGDFKFIFGRSVIPENSEEAISTKVYLKQKINNRSISEAINAIGLVTPNIKNKFKLSDSNETNYVDIKISQYLATKLNIWETNLKFSKPKIKIDLPLNNDVNKTLTIQARIVGIVDVDFISNRIYYSYSNLFSYIKKNIKMAKKEDAQFKKQVECLIDLSEKTKFIGSYLTNFVFSKNKIPNILLNFSIPINSGSGANWEDYIVKNDDKIKMNLVINDFYLIRDALIKNTKSYIILINNLIYILTLIGFLVSMLLMYLFLVQNSQNILLFKSLGYKLSEIVRFMIWGYGLAAVLAVGFSSLFSILAISLMKNAFLESFNISIKFAMTWNYGLAIFLLPAIFIVLILTSLIYYIYKQEPKKILNMS